MIYFISQIAIFLLLAAALGLAVGWLLRGLVAARRQVEASSEDGEKPGDPFGEPPAWE